MSEYIELEISKIEVPKKFSIRIDISSDGNRVSCCAINNDTNFRCAIDGRYIKYTSKMETIIDTILSNIIEVF